MPVDVGRRQRLVLCVQNLSVPKDPRVWREARTLAAVDFDVTVICPRDKGQSRREQIDGVKIIRYGPSFEGVGAIGLLVEIAVGVIAISWHTLRLRVTGRIDVFHVANPPDVFFPLGRLVTLTGAKFIFDLHDPSVEVLRAKFGERKVLLRIATWLEKRSLRTANLVIATNGSLRRIALERSGKRDHEVVVVRTGPDTVAEPPAAQARSQSTVAFAGIIGEQDGVEVLLRAIKQLVERGENVRLEIVGDGADVPRLKQLCSELGVDSITTWAGWLSRDEMTARLQGAAVAVSPDDDSELNRLVTLLKLGDYLSVGLPVVASDLPESRVTCGEAALYVRPGDPSALADGIQKLLNDDALRASLSAAARNRAQTLLWEHSGKRLVATYRWLLGGGQPPEPEQDI